MNNSKCLTDQDLVLHYYGELSTNDERIRHLVGCRRCGDNFAALEHDLARLPELTNDPGFAAGTRMAARVSEQLIKRRRTNWLPALGISVVAACALVIAISTWSPQGRQVQVAQFVKPSQESLSFNEDMPDIDFLEDLELLNELELLSQIEGV